MDIKETCLSKIGLDEFFTPVSNFVDTLKSHGFKDIKLSLVDKQVTLKACFKSGTSIEFEVGGENVYLKNTPFHSKESHDELLRLVIKLYWLD